MLSIYKSLNDLISWSNQIENPPSIREGGNVWFAVIGADVEYVWTFELIPDF